jgi:hypothetical protein
MTPVIPTQQSISELSIIPIALILAVVSFLGLAFIVGILVIVVVANRADPDSSGRRPLAVYFFGMSFIAVFLTLFGTYAIVLGLVQLIGSHTQSAFPTSTPFPLSSSAHPIGDAVARVVVISALVVLVGVALLSTHLKRALALPEWRHGAYGPVGRVAQSYAAAVCFIAVLVAAVTFIALGYDVCRIIAPGVFELAGPRIAVVRTIISLVYLLAAAVVVVVLHSRIPPNGFWGAVWSPHGGSGETPHGGAPAVPVTQGGEHRAPVTPRPPPPPPPRTTPQAEPPQSPPLPTI